METALARDKWHERLIRSGYFVGAVLLHLIIFLLVATFVVFRPPVQDTDTKFIQVAIRPPPPPPAPPAASGGQTMSNLEPSVETVAPPTAPSVVTTMSPSNFSVQSVKVSLPNMTATPASSPEGTGLSGQGAPGPSAGSGSSPFGSESSSGAVQLQGFLYDLKQTADKKPNGMIPSNYHRTLTKFNTAGWNPSILAPYYKSPTALNTSSIFIPTIGALDGPKAFHVEADVQPNMYVIWYKTKAAPAQDGTYHFVGVGDDILLVRVDGKTVLDGSLSAVDDKLVAQEQKLPILNFRGSCPPDREFKVGIPFHASAAQAVDIEVLIGEEPGGYSNYFLYIQREESTYSQQTNSTPLLPVFQLDSSPLRPEGKPFSYPAYSKDPEPWGAGK